MRAITALAILVAAGRGTSETIEHGRFAAVAISRPARPARDVALLLGSRANPSSAAVARALAERGSLVIGVDVDAFLARLEADGAACEFADGDLENLSHFVQGYAGLDSYYRPWLVGIGSGASLVYAMLAQAPPETFAGGISLGFSPRLPLRKPLCPGIALQSQAGPRSRLLPSKRLSAPWVALQCGAAAGCDGAAEPFATREAGAARASLPGVGPDYADPRALLPPLLAAYEALSRRVASREPPPPKSLEDMPLIETPASGTGELFGVILSGDGGWAGLDKALAAQLAAHGIPVVGIDSLRYFWRARTPARVGADLDRVLRFYAARWKRPRALVIGYSQGADVLPFALNRLGRPARRIVWRVVLLGIGRSASFEFHLGNWIGMGGAGIPILPEALRLSGENTICIYGESDDTLCPQLDPRHARAIALPGGHHFDGDYARLAALILGSTEPNPAALGGTRAPLGPPARAAPPRPPADLRR